VRSRQVCRATHPALPFGSEEVSLDACGCQRTAALAGVQRLFAHLVGQLTAWLKRKTGEAVQPDRSSSVRLSALSKDGRGSAAGVCGAKMHIVVRSPTRLPIYAAVTPANVNDITCRQGHADRGRGHLRVRPQAIMTTAGGPNCTPRTAGSVTRLKSNTKLRVVRKNRSRRAQIFFPTASATCHNVWHATVKTVPESRPRNSACASTPERSYASSPMTSIYRS